LKQEFSDRDGNMGEANEAGDDFVENRCLQLDSEKLRIVRVERGVEIALYGGEIDTVVFQPGVITHHRECENRKDEYQQEIASARIL
jgi:hypothetical protein